MMDKARTLTQDIAKCMGEPWKYEDAEHSPRRAKFVRGNGAQVWLRIMGGRVRVSGLYPGNHLPWGTEYPRITVAISRGADAIAKDIQRRFLPKYLLLFEQNMRAKADDEEFSRKKKETEESLCEILDGEIVLDNIRFDGPGGCYGTIRVSGDSVTVELRSLDLESAKRLACFLLADKSKAAAINAERAMHKRGG